MHAPRKPALRERLVRSRYFLFAVLLHLLILAMIGTMVVFHAPPPEKPPESVGLPPESVSVVPPGPENAIVDRETALPPAPGPVNRNEEILSTSNPTPGQPSIAIPSPQLEARHPRPPEGTPMPPGSTRPSEERRKELQGTARNWVQSVNGVKTPGRYEFKVHLARYAQGDWDGTVEMKEGKIVGGSLVNLAAGLERLTRGRVRPEVSAVPLNLADPEILESRPPFLFFTGHKDFVLTEAEVTNLRRYLFLGGAIWGDNGLAGHGSRFDVAFRREMRRVLVNIDQEFETLPADHPILAKGYFQLRELPSGMNLYREPMEAVFLDGKLAVIYTLNDYADMLRFVFRPDMLSPDLEAGPDKLAMPSGLWKFRNVYYRNFEPGATLDTYRLAGNIVQYLLTRFDDQF